MPDGVYEHFAAASAHVAREARESWEATFDEYRAAYPDLADEIERMQRRELPDGWDARLPAFPPDPKGIASRDSSGQVLNALAQNVPWLIGGAADLSPSTKTRLTFDGAGDFQPDAAAGATSTSASASTPRPRSPTAWRCQAARRTGPAS